MGFFKDLRITVVGGDSLSFLLAVKLKSKLDLKKNGFQFLNSAINTFSEKRLLGLS